MIVMRHPGAFWTGIEPLYKELSKSEREAELYSAMSEKPSSTRSGMIARSRAIFGGERKAELYSASELPAHLKEIPQATSVSSKICDKFQIIPPFAQKIPSLVSQTLGK